MRGLVQRVTSASVSVEVEVIGQIEHGILLLLGIHQDDTGVLPLVKKVVNLRIFPDDQDRMNLNLDQIGGEILIISQFTLYADCSKGNRPSFFDAAPPEKAESLYEEFLSEMGNLLGKDLVQSGRFGAKMAVSLVNDGPVTLIL